MITTKLMEAFAFSAPIVSALVCMVMMLMNAFGRKHSKEERNLRLFLALTYLTTSLGWLGMVFYCVSPRIFTYYCTVFLLTLMLDQVLIYRFVSIITSTGERRRFNRLHLIVPLCFTAISVVGDFTVPVDVQTTLIYSGEGGGGSGFWFRMMYILTTVIFIVYNTLYPLLNLRNIRRYQQFVVNYSSDTYHTSLGWLATVQMLIMITVPLPFAGLLMGIPSVALSYFAWLGALPYFVNYLILCYNLLNDNYLIVPPKDLAEDTTDEADAANVVIDRKYFERYLHDCKPYLDPKLRITDMALQLKTNRTYLSGFINKEYGMNFSRLINRLRLQELDRLRLSARYSGRNNMELVLKAGFANYRNYLRVKTEEDKLTILKVFE